MTGFDTLALAVRGPVVVRYVGELLVGMAVMVGVPAVFALANGDAVFALRAWLVLVVVVAAGLAGRRRPAVSDLQINESLVVVALTFLIGSAAMTWPFMSEGLTVWDAGFESVSALTTTGLTTIADVEAHSRAFLFARAWMQWCGGLVIVVLALGLVIEPGPAARRLLGADSDGGGVVQGTRQRVRHALVVYVALLVAGMLLLIASGLGVFEALLHSLTAVSTGGFSSHGDSIAGMGLAARAAVILLALCGAVPLALYWTTWRTGWRAAVQDVETLALLVAGLVVSGVMVTVLVMADGYGLAESLRAGPLLALSAQTTSGFEAARVAGLTQASRAALLLPMLVGGALGSTAGGMKIVRALMAIRVMGLLVRRARLPLHAVVEGPPPEAIAMLGLVLLYLVVIVASWLPLLFLNVAPLDSLFEVVSAIGTVGLSSGMTTTALPSFAKGVLCLDMLMGRLEIVAMLLLVYPGTWIGRRTSTS